MSGKTKKKATTAKDAAMFKDILEKGEKVKQVWRPNKCKTWWEWMLILALCVIPLAIGPIIAKFDDEVSKRGFDITLWVTISVALAAIIITVICCQLWLNKRYYAYTNKRILIRGGIIGVDYKSLEFKSLTATVAKVNLLDKLIRKNTGSIKFGSPASPVMSLGSGHSNQFIFAHIVAPYVVLREIKEFINEGHKDSAN